MKKLITLMSLLVIIGLGANVFAQTDSGTTPFVGSQHTYSVDNHAGNGYSWSVTTDAEGTSSFAGVTITNGSTNSASITWDSPTPGTTYYVHVIETANGTSCTNRKALAVVPVNAFELEIVNVNTSDEVQSEDFASCPPDASVTSYDGTPDGTLAEAQDFTYDFDASAVYYRITASGINTTNTGWSPQFTIATTNTTGATVSAQWATSIGGSYTGSLSVDGSTNDIDVSAGNASIWVRVTIDNGDSGSGLEGLTAQDITVTLLGTANTSEDEYGNDVTDTGNGDRNQVISARPATSVISTSTP